MRGFTLLEVLIALTILALSLTAALKTASVASDNSRYLRDKTLAHWVAMNILTEIQIKRQWPTLGRQEGSTQMANRTWYWHLQVKTTIDPELRRLELTVFEQPNTGQPLSLLTGFIAAPQ